MCGLFGCITQQNFILTPELATKRNAVLRGLALAMEKRGDKSTGIAGINKEYSETYKKPVPAHVLIDRDAFTKFLDNNYNIILGHTRMPTMGVIAERNAHPFRYGNIVGTHNGQLFNWRSINKDVEVDSQAIFYELNKDKNDYQKTFKKLYGSFALAWINIKKPNTLHLVAETAPLHLMYVHQIKTYFYASEHFPLEAIVNAHFNLKKRIRSWATESSKVYTLTTKLQITKIPVSFSKYEREERSTTYSTPYSRGWGRPHYEDPQENIQKTYDIKKPNNIFKRITHEGDHIILESVEELKIESMRIIERLIEDEGCSNCHRKIQLATDEGFYWVALRNHVLCMECMTESTIPFQYLLWIEWSDYQEITEELDELVCEFKKYDH